jgi:hypothetical protein
MSAGEGGGGWFVLGLGLVGLAGGGLALARSRLAARAPEPAAPAVAPPERPPPAPVASSAASFTPAPMSVAPVTAGIKPPPRAPGAPSPTSPVGTFVRYTGPSVPVLPANAPRGPLTRSTVDRRGAVRESPAKLLAEARRAARDESITLDELAGARLAASEYGGGTPIELAAIVDAELNRAQAAGRSLFESLTRGAGFGRQGQGSKRPASTRLDPEFRHLWAARAVLVGFARGISRGAVAFFNPGVMDRLHSATKAGRTTIPTSCDALDLLELWSFDRPRLTDSKACPFDRTKVGRSTHAWVGPIAGVDAWRLMLLAPMATGPEHLGAYVAARQVIERGRALAGGQKGTV